MNINKELKKYIEENIFPSYEKNDLGHNLSHINYVIDRSLKFADTIPNINLEMVYVIAAYHDIGHYIDAKNHEKVSAEMLKNDKNLKKFFSKEQIDIMTEAVEDHRASLEYEPRSIYGKIVSSADRNTLIDIPLKRTYLYRVKHFPNATLDQIIEESRLHLKDKFGKSGYANEKIYFEDEEYETFLKEIDILVGDKDLFRKRYIEVNHLGEKTNEESNMGNNKFKDLYIQIKEKTPGLSLDQLLYEVYEQSNSNQSFDVVRPLILEANNIDEYKYYTKDVSEDLKRYIEEFVFPEYDKNDKAHGIIHIKEVIRRSFSLNDTLKLKLNIDMIYAIAACHDLGKYIDHKIHEKIAADIFIKDNNMKKFFDDEQRIVIKEAIEDHRSSKEDTPRSEYGKLISSADRNTRIEIVFIRSFFVAKTRTPDMTIEDYLDYTFDRLSKRYGEENPENIFYEDNTYKVFLQDMRNLLKNEKEFKDKYCEVNHIRSRNNIVADEQGELEYIKSLKNRVKHN